MTREVEARTIVRIADEQAQTAIAYIQAMQYTLLMVRQLAEDTGNEQYEQTISKHYNASMRALGDLGDLVNYLQSLPKDRFISMV